MFPFISLTFISLFIYRPFPAVVKQGRGMGLSWGYWAGSVPLD
jgi:hypothetical protein